MAADASYNQVAGSDSLGGPRMEKCYGDLKEPKVHKKQVGCRLAGKQSV